MSCLSGMQLLWDNVWQLMGCVYQEHWLGGESGVSMKLVFRFIPQVVACRYSISCCNNVISKYASYIRCNFSPLSVLIRIVNDAEKSPGNYFCMK